MDACLVCSQDSRRIAAGQEVAMNRSDRAFAGPYGDSGNGEGASAEFCDKAGHDATCVLEGSLAGVRGTGEA